MCVLDSLFRDFCYGAAMMRIFTQRPTSPSNLVRRVHYEPNTHMPYHCDGQTRLSLILAGRVHETAGRRQTEAGVLGVALKSADARHATRFGPEGACVASIDLDQLATPDDQCWYTPHWRWACGVELRPELHATITAIVEMHRMPQHPDALDALREACLLLSDRLSTRESPQRQPASAWLRAVRERLDDAPEAFFTVADLAREAGVSTTHLTRRFRAAYGQSVTGYRTVKRIQRALQQLSVPNCRLADVAIEAGFHDQAHFTRHFRAVTGTTPDTWRRQLLAAD